jgi:hypothetical protein
MISEAYIKELKDFQASIFTLQKSNLYEMTSNKEDENTLKILANIEIMLASLSIKFNNLLNPPAPILSNQHVCTCVKGKLLPDCVFDNPKITCDKLDENGSAIVSKEKCPYWKIASDFLAEQIDK